MSIRLRVVRLEDARVACFLCGLFVACFARGAAKQPARRQIIWQIACDCTVIRSDRISVRPFSFPTVAFTVVTYAEERDSRHGLPDIDGIDLGTCVRFAGPRHGFHVAVVLQRHAVHLGGDLADPVAAVEAFATMPGIGEDGWRGEP